MRNPATLNPNSVVDSEIHGARAVNRSAELTTKPGVAKAQNGALSKSNLALGTSYHQLSVLSLNTGAYFLNADR